MTPIALFVYNRPAHTKRVLQALRRNNIDVLYIFSDAVKDDKNNSRAFATVKEVRKIINQINWVETRITEQEKHQGLAGSVIKGVTAVLDEYDRIIVLEDDCVPGPGFYSYMCQCLSYYKNERQIGSISGYLHPISKKVFREYKYDVFFWGRFWSWGWGTWRRVWEKFKPELENLLKEIREAKIDTAMFGPDVAMDKLKLTLPSYDSWATPFFLYLALTDSLTVYPTLSHVNNIGCDGSGRHCGFTSRYKVFLSKSKQVKKYRFPADIFQDKKITSKILDFLNQDKPTFQEAIKKLVTKIF